MRLATFFPAILASSLCGCQSSQPGAPYSLAPRLPYAACGDMTTLRANLTGNRDLSPESDALLRELGVRCLGAGVSPSAHVISEIAPGWSGR